MKNVKQNIMDVGGDIDFSKVHFWSQKGQTSADGLEFLKSLQSRLKHGRCVVLFWHVTCDLTALKRPERYLVNQFDAADELLEYLGPTFDGLVKLHDESPFDVRILQTPPIFWKTWNQQHGDPDWDSKDEALMHQQVNVVNQRINNINERLHYRSPLSMSDCMEFRKRKADGQHRQSLTSVLL